MTKKVYKCIIAEDERKMANLIKILGHWTEYNIEIVDICYNGIDAFDSIIKYKPEIIITDIKMPGHDGLKLIEKCKEEGIECVFIIVSGYKHFEYAKSALQYGVSDYILKPIDETQLNDALRKAINQIDEKITSKTIQTERDEYREKLRVVRNEKFWNKLYESAVNTEADFEMQEFQDIFSKVYLKENYKVMFIRTSINQLLAKNSLFIEKLDTIFKKIESEDISILYHHNANGISIILNFEDQLARSINQVISGIYYSLRNLTEIYGDFDLTIGHSLVSNETADLSKLLSQAVAAESAKLIYGANKIFSFEIIQDLKEFDSREFGFDEYFTKLEVYSEYLQVEEIKKIHEDFVRECSKYGERNPISMLKAQRVIIDKSLRMYLKDDEIIKETGTNILNGTDNVRSFSELMNVTFRLLEEEFDLYVSMQQKKHIQPTEKAIGYIELNYSNPISLEDVAAYVELSPAYFSKIFKSEMGKGYAEYISGLRIDKSKKLLAETKESVKSIAISVGYPDQKYYSKLFKKMTGIKPSEYRKLYS